MPIAVILNLIKNKIKTMPRRKILFNKKQKREVSRIVEYLVSGGIWFWTGYIIIVVLVKEDVPLFWANLAGNGVGITLNFFISRYWVFRTKRKTKLGVATKRYIVYTGVNAFLLNYMILGGLRKVGIEPEIGQFIASGFFTVWNYLWYKAWVFKGRERIRRTKHYA